MAPVAAGARVYTINVNVARVISALLLAAAPLLLPAGSRAGGFAGAARAGTAPAGGALAGASAGVTLVQPSVGSSPLITGPAGVLPALAPGLTPRALVTGPQAGPAGPAPVVPAVRAAVSAGRFVAPVRGSEGAAAGGRTTRPRP